MTGKTKNRLFSIAGIGVGLVCLVGGSIEFMHSKRLADAGKTTTGTVMCGVDKTSGRFRTHSYFLDVRFKPENGSVITPHIKVTEETYKSAGVGSEVKVHYLPDDLSILQAGETVKLRYFSILFGIGFLGLCGFLLVKSPGSPEEEIAGKLMKSLETLSVTQYEYAPAKAENFPHLDLAFYDDNQRQLEARGFRFLDDQENVTLRKTGTSTFIRYLLSNDQTTIVYLYCVMPKSGKPVNVVELDTRLSNSRFVSTSNSSTSKLDPPAAFRTLRLPADTTVEKLLESHQDHVNRYQAEDAEAKAVKFEGMAGIRRSSEEQQRIKAEYRKQNGYSKAEVERLTSKSGKELDKIYEALTELRKQPKAA